MALADMSQQETDNRNREHCKSIAERLDLIAGGCIYRDEDGEEHDVSAEDMDDVPDEWEQVSLVDFFEDCYNIRYVFDSDMDYLAVRVMVACGGPNIWVDTESGGVELYWWGDRARYPLSRQAVEEIDAFWAEVVACR